MNNETFNTGLSLQKGLGGRLSDMPESELVTIKLPRDIAQFLSETAKYDLFWLRLILNQDVFSSITLFFDTPTESKKVLDEILFGFLEGVTIVGDGCIHSEQVYFLQHLNGLFQSYFDFVEKKLKEEQNHV